MDYFYCGLACLCVAAVVIKVDGWQDVGWLFLAVLCGLVIYAVLEIIAKVRR